MSPRVLIAALAGAVVMFVWVSIAHMMTPLATTGISRMNNEPATLTAMQAAMPADGLYMFPGMDPNATDKKAEMAAYMAKAKVNPTGLVVFHAPKADQSMTRQLVGEFVIELICVLMAAILVNLANIPGFLGRVLTAVAVGVPAVLWTNGSYWLWYGFPGSYTLAYMAIELIGFILAGLVLAALLRPKLRLEI
jgi:hypothetical protein